MQSDDLSGVSAAMMVINYRRTHTHATPFSVTDLSKLPRRSHVSAAPGDINVSAVVSRGRVVSDIGVADGLFGSSSRALSQHSRLELCVGDGLLSLLPFWPGIDAGIAEFRRNESLRTQSHNTTVGCYARQQIPLDAS
jgi:hypothetical protein